MRISMWLLAIISLVSFSGTVRAAESSGGHRFSLTGFYGTGFINPSDVNAISGAQAATPKFSSFSNDTIFGGKFGMMLTHKLQLVLIYEQQTASNTANTTLGASTGYQLSQNEGWAGLNYFLAHTGKAYLYAGGALGYPTYSHVTATLGSKTEYDADKAIGYRAQLGGGFVFASHFTLFVEGAYEMTKSGSLKTGTTTLNTPSGSAAKLDLSGFNALGGLGFVF